MNIMKRIKSKLLVIALFAACMSIAAYGTVAYFTTEDKAHNVITSAGVDISVVEWQMVGGERVPYPEEPVSGIMPGDTVSKIVTVESADADTYIRALVDITVKDADGNVMELTDEELATVISLDYNTEKWSKNETDDGYWYYADAIGGGAATEPLFKNVTFAAVEMDNEFQNCTIEIDVSAEGVQSANNGATVFEAAGWK